jgi:hypothetical protein
MSQSEPGPSSLAEAVTSQMLKLGGADGPLSLRNAVARSRGRLSTENLRRIARGEHQGNFSDRVAEGLSIALEIPRAEVYRLAGLPQPKTRWVWDAKYDRLTLAQRAIVEDVASGFLMAYEQGRRDAAQ